MPRSLPSAPPATERPQAATVVTKACVRAAEHLGLNNAALAEILGISRASVSRMHTGDYVLPPDSKPYELALLLIRVFRGLDAMMNGEAPAMRSWVDAPNLALGGTPRALLAQVTGLVETVAYVDSARARL